MKLIKRSDWGANSPKSSYSKLGEVKGLVIHWSAYPTAMSEDEEYSTNKNNTKFTSK